MSDSTINWAKSAAHLLLLSKFLAPTPSESFQNSEPWTRALKETAEEATKRFLEDGVIEPPGLTELLDYKCRVPDLKAMLKERRLPVSGRKKDLIDRLIQADPQSMKVITNTLSLLRCSDKGRLIAEKFKACEEEKQIRNQQEVLDKLKDRKFHEAAVSVASFEAEQVFPRGLNIDWKNYDLTSDLAMLESMFTRKPKILARIRDEQLEWLRIAAGMVHLWGTERLRVTSWLPDFDTGLDMDNISAVRMIISDARHQLRMVQYKQAGVTTLEISTIDDASHCQACRRLASNQYPLEDMPDLPYELCKSETGCRCLATPESQTFL